MSYVVDYVGEDKKPVLRKVRRNATVVKNGEVQWRKGHEPGQVYQVPEEMQKRMHALAPMTRVPPREQFENLLQMLITDARNMFLKDGVVRWPESIKRQLQTLGWKEGRPNMWEEIETLARHYVVYTANKQKEADGKHVTRE